MPTIMKRIGSIKFACLSPDEIRKMAVMKVLTPDTYDDTDKAIVGGLMDKRMGVVEPGARCETCKQKMDECPGHFGYIELSRPVVHVGFVKDIKMLLESTCQYCGKLMLTDEEIEKYKADRAKITELGGDIADSKIFSKETVKHASSSGTCPHCHKEQEKIRLDKPTTFRIVNNNQLITAQQIRERLERIPDDDLKILGYDPLTCRPEWMVLKVLPIPPVRVRPTIVQGARKQEDDLTHKLVDIIKINRKLGEQRDLGSPLLIVEDLWNLLQIHITHYFDNQTSGIPPATQRGSSRPLKTIAQRLKGKEGRFRSNLSGKRVNFSARTVISPDPLLSINEVGVPREIARELTVPERVNVRNIEYMRKLILRGPTPEDENGKYVPGVNYVIRPDGRRIKISEDTKEYNASEEVLKPDFVVERQLQDGDIVLFNRQPSLHRMSMMAHEVRIMDGHTFRFNLCDCPPYNADFDGDEMNMHVLQSLEARAEAKIIMKVQENILSPRYGGPIIGAIHDHITGAFFLTNDTKCEGGPFFDKMETMSILSKLKDIEIPKPTKVENGKESWSGKELFSLILPKDYNAEYKSKICLGKACPNKDKCLKEKCHSDAYVKIVDGKLIAGTIDANSIGNSKGKIIDKIAHDYGNTRAAQFINEVTRLALGALMNHGFSTGIDDEDIPEDAILEIHAINEEKIAEVERVVKSYNDGTLEQMPGRTVEDTLEVLAQKYLAEARDGAGEIADKHLGMTNPAVIMANTGARGSMLNLSQMAGCVGQQTVRGERLSRGYWERTLPHFEPEDLGAFARGYVIHSYKDGLSPTEFFFHAMGGREGLVDTAVRTSRSGYMQRRLVSALEDLKIAGDGTVRNTSGNIIQFRYGEDGSDPSKTLNGEVIDYQSLFMQTLSEDKAKALIQAKADESVESAGENYATKEKDLMSVTTEDTDEEYDSGDDEGDE